MKKTVLVFTGILIVAMVTGYAGKSIYISLKDNFKTEQARQEKFLQKTQPPNGISQSSFSNQELEPPTTSRDIPTSSDVGNLSNKSYGWGVVRNRNHLQPEMQEAHQTVMDNLHNGGLILLHTVTKDNLDSLDQTITEIKLQGYKFKTLDDLVKKL